MARKGTETEPLLPKPTLKRKQSTRSFALARRSTIHFFRRKLRRAKTIVTPKASRPSPADYFTGRLPVEIRLQIYGYLLKFDAPLMAVHNTRRSQPPKNLAILRVSRLVRAEALSVFYDLNTLSVPRSAFCKNLQNRTEWPSQVRNLYVNSLAPSIACIPAAWPAQRPKSAPKPCVNCGSCLLAFTRTLRDLPCLRELAVDYHGHAGDIERLAASLVRDHSQGTDVRLTCVGVGKYTLTGSWFANTSVELRDVLLCSLWQRLLPAPQSDFGSIISTIRKIRAQEKAFAKDSATLPGKQHVKFMTLKVQRIVGIHNRGRISQAMSDMWPQDLEMDFKIVDDCGRPEFLHKFNVDLQRQLTEGTRTSSTTMRRGHVDPFSQLFGALGTAGMGADDL